MAMTLAALVWAVGDGFLVMEPSPAIDTAIVTVTFTCISTLILAWLLFALEFAGRKSSITRGRVLLFAVIPIVTVFLVATNGRHNWVWRYHMVGDKRLAENGPAMLVFLAFVYSVFFLGLACFLQMLVRSSPARRTSTLVVLTAGLIPWVADVVQLVVFYPNSPRSIVPYTFILSGPLLAWGLFRLRLLQMAPVARNRVFESMDAGVVVLDRLGHVADLNPAATRLLRVEGGRAPAVGDRLGIPNLQEGDATGSGAAGAVTDWVLGVGSDYRVLEVRRKPLLHARGHAMGSLVFLRDMTAKRAAAIERERLLADLRAASSRVRTLSGLLPICAGCKQIRDKQGNWLALGTYLRAHSEARPTSGLCPECRANGFFPA